jgi:hypothetical protein
VDSNSFGFKPLYLTKNEQLSIVFHEAGIYLPKNFRITLSVQLQNLEKEAKDVYIGMDYNYFLGQPEGYINIIPVSQDALGISAMMGGCIEQAGAWERTSTLYKSGQDAPMAATHALLHLASVWKLGRSRREMLLPPKFITTLISAIQCQCQMASAMH